MKEARQMGNGYTLLVEETEQGRAYWTDEVGGGVCVWHTALVSRSSLLEAMAHEEGLAMDEARNKRK